VKQRFPVSIYIGIAVVRAQCPCFGPGWSGSEPRQHGFAELWLNLPVFGKVETERRGHKNGRCHEPNRKTKVTQVTRSTNAITGARQRSLVYKIASLPPVTIEAKLFGVEVHTTGSHIMRGGVAIIDVVIHLEQQCLPAQIQAYLLSVFICPHGFYLLHGDKHR